MKVNRLFDICIQISDIFARLVSEIVRPRIELRRGEAHAAVTSQLRIPSQTSAKLHQGVKRLLRHAQPAEQLTQLIDRLVDRSIEVDEGVFPRLRSSREGQSSSNSPNANVAASGSLRIMGAPVLATGCTLQPSKRSESECRGCARSCYFTADRTSTRHGRARRLRAKERIAYLKSRITSPARPVLYRICLSLILV